MNMWKSDTESSLLCIYHLIYCDKAYEKAKAVAIADSFMQ
jgi:hypothetical protein